MMRKLENNYNKRIAVYTYNAGLYIVKKYSKLRYTDIIKKFNFL